MGLHAINDYLNYRLKMTGVEMTEHVYGTNAVGRSIRKLS